MRTDEERPPATESVWFDVIAAALAGRASGLFCPECGAEGLREAARGNRVVVSCGACERFIEVERRTH